MFHEKQLLVFFSMATNFGGRRFYTTPEDELLLQNRRNFHSTNVSYFVPNPLPPPPPKKNHQLSGHNFKATLAHDAIFT